jgi:hypothetical protein
MKSGDVKRTKEKNTQKIVFSIQGTVNKIKMNENRIVKQKKIRAFTNEKAAVF